MIKKFLFTIVTLLIALLILEVSFRLMYSIKYHNFDYMLFGLKNVLKIDTDKLQGYIKMKKPARPEDELYNGFRTAPFLLEKPKNEYRIVALGGSTTYGFYDGYYESWPYLLENKLNQSLDDKKYKVINAGIPGQTTNGINRLLTEEVISWKPDMIILHSLYNHINIDTPTLHEGGKGLDYGFRMLTALLYDKSLLATYLINVVGLKSGSKFRTKQDTYRYLLGEIIDKANQENIKIIVLKQLILPELFRRVHKDSRTRDTNVFSPEQYKEFLAIIDEVSEEKECILVDFSAFSNKCEDKLDILLKDKKVHFSDYGKELLAETLAEEIIETRESKYETARN